PRASSASRTSAKTRWTKPWTSCSRNWTRGRRDGSKAHVTVDAAAALSTTTAPGVAFMNARPIVKSARGFTCVLTVACLLPATESRPDEPNAASTHARDVTQRKAPGDVRDDNRLKMKLVWCPPGVVVMENVELVAETPENDDEPDQEDAPAREPKLTNR